MKNLYIIVLILLIGFVSCVKDEDLKEPSNVNTNAPVLINELLSTGDPDWVELYNLTNEVVDLTGYVLSDGGADFVIPAGISIEANGYLVFLADDGNIVDEAGIHTNFKISSGGELMKLADAEGALVDQIDLPGLEPGTSYGRTVDGGDVWDVLNPTQGAPNSNDNIAPVITADSLTALDDNTRMEIVAQVVDISGVREVKIFYTYNGTTLYADMAPIGDNEYTYTLPLIPAGQELTYYIFAADETGLKSYFPETAPDDGIKVQVENGAPLVTNFTISNGNPAANEDVVITVDAFDVTGIDEVRLYYVITGQTVDDKVRITMDLIGGTTYQGIIPGQANDTEVSYYLRAEDIDGMRTYYPLDEDFDNDILEMWPSYTVAPPTILEALVMNELQGGGDPDYIELFNGTSADIDLGGYKLHDSDPTEAYEIPAGTIIPAGGFWVLDCDGDAITLFKISSSGEDITLLDPSGNIVDQILKDNWPVDHGALIGRVPDGADFWSIMDAESKGESNNN